jgi:hypothetical protein
MVLIVLSKCIGILIGEMSAVVKIWGVVIIDHHQSSLCVFTMSNRMKSPNVARKVALLGSSVAVFAFTCGFVGTKVIFLTREQAFLHT